MTLKYNPLNNITSLYAHRALPLASAAVVTPQQALASGATAASLRAVADWNERKSYDERRRKARSRHKAQAAALRAVADQFGDWQVRGAA